MMFVAALHAAYISRLDREPMMAKITKVWQASMRNDEGVGVFDDAAQHHWSDDAKVFYYALRLDGMGKEDAVRMVEHATRAR